MQELSRREKIEVYFKENPINGNEISLLKSVAINEFLSSVGETQEDAVKIYDFLQCVDNVGTLQTEFEKLIGFEFLCLERYEDLYIKDLLNGITELFDSSLTATKAIIAERCVY